MDRTEQKIVQVFGDLLQEMPLNKITVRELVKRCGINRNTFYYHFQDIPSLLERILREWADQMFQNHGKPNSVLECIYLLVDYGERYRQAALHIYHSMSREVFVRNLEEVALYIVTEYVDSAAQDYSVQPVDRAVLIRYYKCTFVGVILDWFNDKMCYDLRHDAKRVCYLLDGSAQMAFRKSEER